VEDDFESGSAGWTPSGGCSTGSFILGTPTLVTSGGVTTQVSGDHTLGNGNALFTASNTSVGVNDVDGGTCSLASPSWSVLEDSDLSLWYFHGQRDSGDDPGGDFFRLDYSLDGGSSWLPLATHGDVSLDADWTEVNTSIPAGSTLTLRVLASDGTGPGDLVEAGIDDLSVCPVP